MSEELENQDEQVLSGEVADSQEEQQKESQVNEIEEKAKRMGWKPRDEYKGNPDTWTDPETFVKVGEERIPVMKENYNKLEDKYKTLEQKVKAQEDYQKHMAKVQYERAMKDLKEQQKAAVEDADTEKYEQLEKQKEQIQSDYSPKQTEEKQDIPPEVSSWIQKNTWYQNPSLAAKAAEVESAILQEEAFKASDDPFYTPISLSERLEEVAKRVKSQFRKEPARKLPAVEGARTESAKKAAKTYNDLPPDAKEACNEYVKKGILSREEYVKDYFGEQL